MKHEPQPRQQSLYDDYAVRRLVSPDHPLLVIDRAVDFEFVHDLIIAILAAILFPVFAKAREKARQASCESNEKQIGLACLMYASDYDGCFPMNAPAGCSKVNAYDWMEITQPYVKNWPIYMCPDFNNNIWGTTSPEGLPTSVPQCGASGTGMRSHDQRYGGYALNVQRVCGCNPKVRWQ